MSFIKKLNFKITKTTILFFVLTFLFYGNTLKNKYALDDEYITATNTAVKGQKFIPNNSLIKDGFASIPKIWTSRYAHDTENSFDYRPVVTTTFAIEYGLFGQNPFISHFINVILYFFLICLIYEILLKIFVQEREQQLLAFLTSILFLIHPLHTEVVASLKSRDELLAFIFSLLALKHTLLFIEKPTVKDACLIILFFFFGFLSKLSAVLIMVATPLIIIFYKKINYKKIALITFGIYILYVSFQAFMHIMPEEEHIRIFYRFENPLYTETFSFFEKLIISIKTFGFYIQMLFFPYPLRFYYGSNVFPFSTNLDSYVIFAFIFIGLCSIYYWKKRDRDFLFSFLFLGLLITPFLNFIDPIAGVVGDRLMFIPSLGFCLLISVSLKPLYPNFKFSNFSEFISKPLIYITSIITICLFYVVNRNFNWYNKLTLFEHDIKHLAKSAKANSLLGNEYFEMLQSPTQKYPIQTLVQKCIYQYNTAVGNDSSFYSAYNNAGVVYYNYLNDIPSAKKYFTLAVRHKDKYYQAYENLGNCYKKEKNITKAFEYYKKAIIANPKGIAAYFTCINLFFEEKQYVKCLSIIKIAESMFPNNYELTAQKANCYFLMGQINTALTTFEEAYTIFPNRDLAKFLAENYLKIGNTNKYNMYNK